MSLSIYKKMGLGKVKPTIVKLHLVDRSYIFSRGEIEKFLIKVVNFIFPAHFVILDIEEDKDVSLIMRHPFLPIRRTLIDVVTKELIIRVKQVMLTSSWLWNTQNQLMSILQTVSSNKELQKYRKEANFQTQWNTY